MEQATKSPAELRPNQYQCHKTVTAYRIIEIENRMDGFMKVKVEFNNDTKLIVLSREYVERNNPQDGGYYVVYEDGYKSYSPAAAFEAGYTRIS